MKHILVDTNIVLDLLGKRLPFYEEAAELFSLADKKKVILSLSSLLLANTHYLLKKFKPEQDTRKVLRSFKVLVQVLSFTDKIADLALNSEFKDFEDAIQYFTAIENSQEMIITRNMSGYRKSKIPVMTAREFIKSLENA
ncbi:MAG: PIN domain-containing protein [Bacteroidales bacterium]|nr:PIN domain-containing protein [Bacteroidales bacterium]